MLELANIKIIANPHEEQPNILLDTVLIHDDKNTAEILIKKLFDDIYYEYDLSEFRLYAINVSFLNNPNESYKYIFRYDGIIKNIVKCKLDEI